MTDSILRSLLLLTLTAGAAVAQMPPAPSDTPPMGPGEAISLSVGTTLASLGVGYVLLYSSPGESVGAGMLTFGVLVAPSVGNLVQGNLRDAGIGAGVRVGGLILVGGSVLASLGDYSFGPTRKAVAISGLVVMAAGTLYDIGAAGRYASRVRITPSVDGRSGTPLAVIRVGL